MKKIVASVLAVIFILSSIAGACIPVFASESLGVNNSESVPDEGIPADSDTDLYEEEDSIVFETEEIEAAEEAGLIPVTLGHRILRTETAAMVILSWLIFILEK